MRESSVQRRIWASYLAAGMTRYAFAAKLGVAYSTVDAWDTESSMPRLGEIMAVCALLGVRLEQIVYGEDGQPLDGHGGAEAELDDGAVKALLAQIEASPAEVAALGEYLATPGARFQRVTRSLVEAFVSSHVSALHHHAPAAEALEQAIEQGIAARTLASAVQSGGKPLEAAQLRAIVSATNPSGPSKADLSVPVAPRKRKVTGKRKASRR